MNRNYEQLPLDRVLVGVCINKDELKEPDVFGGYYSKNQTYYNIEQVSVTSIIGSYTYSVYDKTLSTLELLRSYFHDSIHFNTFRSYRLKTNHSQKIKQEDIHRVQYGFNLRQEDGKSFSNIDDKNSKTTRNLGIIMEGITDEFSKLFVARIIENEKIHLNELDDFEEVVLNEVVSGTVSESCFASESFTLPEKKYLTVLNHSYKTVWNPYSNFINEFSVDQSQNFKNFIFKTMIEGDHQAFREYFNNLLGDLNGFDNLFKSPYFKM
jgi:hypothetical protein